MLNNAIYGLVQAERCCNKKNVTTWRRSGSSNKMRIHACSARSLTRSEDGCGRTRGLAHAKDQSTTEIFAAELRRKCKLKDMGDAKYDMGCHITGGRKAREWKLDQHLYAKSMVEMFGIKMTSRIPGSSGVSTFSKADEPQTPGEREEMLKFSNREAVGALM